MLTLSKVIIILAALITTAPFVLYGIYVIKKGIELDKWRKQLFKGMTVYVDDGTNIFKAKIITVANTYVRILTEDGNSAGYSKSLIYPLNYMMHEGESIDGGSYQKG